MILFYFIYFHEYWCLACFYICAPGACLTRKGCQIPSDRITDSCELLCGCWDSSLGPLEKQTVPFHGSSVSSSPKFYFFLLISFNMYPGSQRSNFSYILFRVSSLTFCFFFFVTLELKPTHELPNIL